jgi:hypothetical protein
MDFLLKEVGSCKDLALEEHSISVVGIRYVDPDREEGSILMTGDRLKTPRWVL